MKLQPEDLQNEAQYELIHTVSYDEVLPFVFTYLKKRNTAVVFFLLLCVLTLALAIASGLAQREHLNLWTTLTGALTGALLMPLLLVPFHECLHGLAYYSGGIRNIRYGMDLSQLIFYVTAHREVVGRNLFAFVALLPCLLITLVLLFLTVHLPGFWSYTTACCLFAHSTMCAGDFAMLSLLKTNKKGELYTYDDVDEKKAFFYLGKPEWN